MEYLTKSPSKHTNQEKSQYLHKNSISKYSKVSDLIKVTMTGGASSGKSKSKKFGGTTGTGDVMKYYENMQMKHSVYNGGSVSGGQGHSTLGTSGSSSLNY